MNQGRTRREMDPPSFSTIRETIMGLVIIFCALAMLLRDRFNLDLSFLPEGSITPFAVAILLYGIWRVYRGIRSYKEERNDTEE